MCQKAQGRQVTCSRCHISKGQFRTWMEGCLLSHCCGKGLCALRHTLMPLPSSPEHLPPLGIGILRCNEPTFRVHPGSFVFRYECTWLVSDPVVLKAMQKRWNYIGRGTSEWSGHSIWCVCLGTCEGQKTMVGVILRWHLLFPPWRQSHWPGAHQVGMAGQPLSPRSPSVSVSPALALKARVTKPDSF